MRSFGTEISANRRPRSELSTEQRAALLEGLDTGENVSKLAQKFGVARSTIYRTQKRFQNQNSLESGARSGRPEKLSQAAKRYIFHMVRRRPRISYSALIAGSPYNVSRSTIQRILRRFYIKRWKSKKRIALDADSTKKRYNFARAWLHFDDLSNIMFSDESSVQRDPSNPTQWVFRFSNEAYRPDLVNLERHGKDVSIMIWASIWYGGRSELVVLERDELSRNGGYSTNSYIACLEKGLLPIYEPRTRFQQDNAKIHISRQAQSWFERHGIWVLDWPPYSPDLNPIENLWRLLKKRLKELYPELFLDGVSEIDMERFRQSIQTAWNSLDQEVINRLVLSWPRRLRAVYKARGWYTKY